MNHQKHRAWWTTAAAVVLTSGYLVAATSSSKKHSQTEVTQPAVSLSVALPAEEAAVPPKRVCVLGNCMTVGLPSMGGDTVVSVQVIGSAGGPALPAALAAGTCSGGVVITITPQTAATLTMALKVAGTEVPVPGHNQVLAPGEAEVISVCNDE